MKYKNIVLLEGFIDDDYQYKKTKDGRKYATFSLIVRSYDRDLRDSTEKRVEIKIRIMVFDYNLVKYLESNNAKKGDVVNILGRLNSYQKTQKDMIININDIVVRDIHIIKNNKRDENI